MMCLNNFTAFVVCFVASMFLRRADGESLAGLSNLIGLNPLSAISGGEGKALTRNTNGNESKSSENNLLDSLLPRSSIDSLLPRSSIDSLLPRSSRSSIDSLLPKSSIDSLLPDTTISFKLPETPLTAMMPSVSLNSVLPKSSTVQSIFDQLGNVDASTLRDFTSNAPGGLSKEIKDKTNGVMPELSINNMAKLLRTNSLGNLINSNLLSSVNQIGETSNSPMNKNQNGNSVTDVASKMLNALNSVTPGFTTNPHVAPANAISNIVNSATDVLQTAVLNSGNLTEFGNLGHALGTRRLRKAV